MNWKENFKEGRELVLATCSKSGEPNANIVISCGFAGEKLLIADCQMTTTIKNLKENKKIAVVGGYYRLRGSVKIHSSGKYLKMCAAKSKEYDVQNAILITIESVFDLDKLKVVK